MFQSVTRHSDGSVYRKPFTWSYSKLKNYRTCPKKHYHNDVIKDVPQETSDALEVGNAVHKAMELRIRDGIPLPPAFAEYEPEALKVLAYQPPGTKILVEEQLAIRRDLTACGYWDKDVWYRSKGDLLKILGIAAIAIDWKTGAIKEDLEQLALMASCVFAAYPDVQKIATRYVWLGNYAQTDCNFTRADMVKLWNGMLPEVQQYEQACTNEIFPPKPSGLCRNHCNVSSCQYFGKGNAKGINSWQAPR